MSFKLFLLAKETGITVKPDTNMIVVFDLLDNLDSYLESLEEEYNDSSR